MRAFLTEWFGSVGRGVGNPKRGWLSDSETFIAWIEENQKHRICSYSSVQPFSAYETPAFIERLFFDFDCKENPGKAGLDAKMFMGRIREFYGVETFRCFSGNKGYHLYVFLENPLGYALPKIHLKLIYAKIQKMILGKFEYPTLDSSVIGDIAQLARVPFSTHEKSKRRCAPLDEWERELNPTEVDLSYYRTYGLPFHICKHALYLLAEDLREKEKYRPRRSSGKKNFSSKIRPCIEDMMNRSHLSHKARIALVAEVHAKGWGKDQIVSVFSGFTDFDRRKTEYQVSHLIRSAYTPFKCLTIQALGECLQEKCPIYRARNKTHTCVRSRAHAGLPRPRS